VKVHHFCSSGEAYDATQCDENIKNGDLLVIESEGVIGIADTWPVAVTVAYGKLHTPAEGYSLARCFEQRPACAASIAGAKKLAASLSFAVRD
jgi:hypothetical protein